MGLGERAPSNMPTELIEQFIAGAEEDLAQSQWSLREAYSAVIAREDRVLRNQKYLDRYRQWLRLRREEENEGL